MKKSGKTKKFLRKNQKTKVILVLSRLYVRLMGCFLLELNVEILDTDSIERTFQENESKTNSAPLLKFEITLKQFEKEISLEFLYVAGENVDALNQIVQYFRNKINQSSSKIC